MAETRAVKTRTVELTSSELRELKDYMIEASKIGAQNKYFAEKLLTGITIILGPISVTAAGIMIAISALAELATMYEDFTDDTADKIVAISGLSSNVYKARVRLRYDIGVTGQGYDYFNMLDFDVLATQASPDSPWAEIM